MKAIYMILNTKKNKVYIGQSQDVTQRMRKQRSTLRCNKHYLTELQNDWNECGEQFFVFNVLEKIEQKEDLDDREEFWTIFYKEQTSCGVYNDHNGRRLSDKTKEKLRQANLGNPGHWKGKSRPEETKQKQSKTMKGKLAGEKHPMWGKPGYWKDKKHSIEWIANISQKLKGQKRSVESRKKMSEAKKGKEPPNKTPVTPEMFADIKAGIDYKTFTTKYGKSANTIKRIKQEMRNSGELPSKFTITKEVLEDVKLGITQKAFKEKYGVSENILKRLKRENN